MPVRSSQAVIAAAPSGRHWLPPVTTSGRRAAPSSARSSSRSAVPTAPVGHRKRVDVRAGKGLTDDVFRQPDDHRTRPAAAGREERLGHGLRRARRVVEHEHPLGGGAEPAAEVELLERLALAVGGGHQADEQEQRGTVLPCLVNTDHGVRRTGAAGDHRDPGPCGELPVRFRRIRGPALVPAHDRVDPASCRPSSTSRNDSPGTWKTRSTPCASRARTMACPALDPVLIFWLLPPIRADVVSGPDRARAVERRRAEGQHPAASSRAPSALPPGCRV